MQPITERFIAKERHESECWEWTGAREQNGYGVVAKLRPNGKTTNTTAHREVYEVLVGPIPEGMTLDHLCRNRACCNPRHLEPVSQGVNTLRGEGPTAQNARKTHCKRGHLLAGKNIYPPTATRPGRRCRICRLMAGRGLT